jgi:hypothetical protein
MTTKKKPWDILSKIDCADKVENKNGLTYLSWAWAWGILKAHFPDASFEKHYFDGLPYASDPQGYAYVKVSVTVEGAEVTETMPVLDYRNKAVKNPDAFSVNSSLQRCLTKAISYHGLGHYIYAGEDLPPNDGEEAPEEAPKEPVKKPKVQKEKPQVKNNSSNINLEEFRSQFLDHHADIVEMDEEDQLADITESDSFDIVLKVFETFMPRVEDKWGASPEEGFGGEDMYETNKDCVKAIEDFYRKNKKVVSMLSSDAPAYHKKVMGMFKAAKGAAQKGEQFEGVAA